MQRIKMREQIEFKTAKWNGKEISIPIEWNVKKIKDAFNVIGGGTPSTTNEEFWNGDIPWLGPQEMSKTKTPEIFSGDKFISNQGAKELGNKKIPINSVILSTRAPVGLVNIAGNEMYTNQGCHSVLPSNDWNPIFVYFLFKKYKHIFKKYSQGTTFKELSSKNLKSIDVITLPLKQQEQISSILYQQENKINNINKLIALYEKRLRYTSNELLSGRLRLKEVYGEAVFYKNEKWKSVKVNGKDVDIPDDWEKNNLINDYITLIPTGVEKFSGKIKYYSTGVITENKLEKHENEYTYEELPSRANLKILENSIYFARMQNTLKVLSFKTHNKEALLSTGFLGLKIDTSHFNHDFICSIIKSNKFQSVKDRNCFGGTQKSLNDGNAKKIEFVYPQKDEQKLISNILSQQEELIQEQNELLELEKKRFTWLLENLLSGKYVIEDEAEETSENLIKNNN